MQVRPVPVVTKTSKGLVEGRSAFDATSKVVARDRVTKVVLQQGSTCPRADGPGNAVGVQWRPPLAEAMTGWSPKPCAQFPRTSAPKVMQGQVAGHENAARCECWSPPLEDAGGEVAVKSACTPPAA